MPKASEYPATDTHLAAPSGAPFASFTGAINEKLALMMKAGFDPSAWHRNWPEADVDSALLFFSAAR